MHSTNDFDLNYMLESLKPYMGLLSSKEAAFLAREAQRGNIESRDKLILHNMRMVIQLAKRYARSYYMDVRDLSIAGISGIITAIDKFNPDFNCKFSTYAFIWVRQTISRHCKHNNSVIKIPLEVQDNKIKNKESFFGTIYIEDVIKKRCKDPGTGNNYTLLESSVDISTEDFLMKGVVSEALQAIPKRDRTMIENYFGMYENDLTLEEIGNKFGVTKERVRQIIEQRIKELRSHKKIKLMLKEGGYSTKNYMTYNKEHWGSIGNIAKGRKSSRKNMYASIFVDKNKFDYFKTLHPRGSMGTVTNDLFISFIDNYKKNRSAMNAVVLYPRDVNCLIKHTIYVIHGVQKYQILKDICRCENIFTSNCIGILVEMYVDSCAKNKQEK